MINTTKNFEVVSPINNFEWNATILKKYVESNIFHSANWARLLVESYGYDPVYVTLLEDNCIKAFLPVMEVDSILTGRRGVSLSFSDYCGAVVEDEADFRGLLEELLQFGKSRGWRYMEFRGEKFLANETPFKRYAHHIIDLCNDRETMLSRLRDSTARNIRKAIKEGVTVKICQSLGGVRAFYRLHCLTRKRHGIPPQPHFFFDNLHEYVISKGLGFTALAYLGNAPIAGVICLHFGGSALYKYGASDIQYQHLRANNLVLWEAIVKCAEKGCSYFSLGRTDLENQGLVSFKNGWGGTESFLNYYRYDFTSSSFMCNTGNDIGRFNILLRKMPLSILNLIGNLAYRHLG